MSEIVWSYRSHPLWKFSVFPEMCTTWSDSRSLACWNWRIQGIICDKEHTSYNKIVYRGFSGVHKIWWMWKRKIWWKRVSKFFMHKRKFKSKFRIPKTFVFTRESFLFLLKFFKDFIHTNNKQFPITGHYSTPHIALKLYKTLMKPLKNN